MQLIGIDPLADTAVRGTRTGSGQGLDAAKRWFTEPGSVVMARGTATRLGIAQNGTFSIRIGGAKYSATLISHLPEERAGFDTLLFTDIAQAQEWLGLVGRLTRIDLRVPSDAEGERALEQLRASLPAGVDLHPA